MDLVSALSAEDEAIADRIKAGGVALGWHLAKFGSRGLIDKGALGDAEPDVNARDEAEKQIGEFKASLRDWAQDSGPKGVVVCVDDLDRCRPDHALALLEVARHLFDVRGVAVLFAINRDELSHSVKSLFGGESSADRYLRRIVDRTIRPPVPKMRELRAFLDNLAKDVWGVYR